jgi:DNA-binding NarL/FixJ family response regulator
MSAPRVMVVDDTDHVRDMLVDMLDLDGFDVVASASSGTEAVKVAARKTPDVIVMDYRMPLMDGLDAAKEIKAARDDQLIIIYSAYLDTNLEKDAREAGVALCLAKAQGLTQLERHITEMCRDLSRN